VSARERLALASRAIAQAEEALRIVRDRYPGGLVIISEVLRAADALVAGASESCWRPAK